MEFSSSSSSSEGEGTGALATVLDLLRVLTVTMAAFVSARVAKTVAGVPLVCSYIAVGLALGPHAVGVLGIKTVTNLWFVRNTALAFVGLVAGSELVFRELEKPKSALMSTLKGIAACLIVIPPGLYVAAKLGMPWLSTLDSARQVAACFVFGVLGTARGPAMAIAGIKELRADGPFTRTVVPVAIMISALNIVLFSIVSSISASVIRGSVRWVDIASIVVSLVSTAALGAAMGGLVRLLFMPQRVLTRIHTLKRSWRGYLRLATRIACIVLIAAIPACLNKVLEVCKVTLFSFDILLCGLCCGLVLVNWTAKRLQFTHALGLTTPYTIAIFFVITGAGLNVAVLAATWTLVPLLFVLRSIALFLGHFIVRRSRHSWKYRAMLWMGFVSQGDVSASMISQLSVYFPLIGSHIAAVCLGTLILNATFGPTLLKTALKILGESGRMAKHGTMVIVGCDFKALLFASKLLQSGWSVMLLELNEEKLAYARDAHRDVFVGLPQERMRWFVLPTISAESLSGIGVKTDFSLVCSLQNDDQNYKLAKAATDLGLGKILVRLNDPHAAERFFALNVLVLDINSALLSFAEGSGMRYMPPLLGPDSNDLIVDLHQQRTVRVVDGARFTGKALEDIRWPLGINVTAVIRGEAWMMPDPGLVLEIDDRVVLVGGEDALAAVGEDKPYVAVRGSGDEDMPLIASAPSTLLSINNPPPQ